MKPVEIYSSRACGLCTEALLFFHQHGVSFTVHAIEYDENSDTSIDSENTREMYRRCGEKVEFVPQIFIGGRHMAGWRKLQPLVESGEIDTLLEGFLF